jgi:hypothetical protein
LPLLFDETIKATPHAVVTEYAWTAKPQYHCDPCPPLDVSPQDMMTLGADIVGQKIASTFVLTRLHARYGKADMKDDLRFKEAKPVTGGREVYTRETGLEYAAVPSSENYFQARYAIRHWWTGPIKCKNPQRGQWGGPPDGNDPGTIAAEKTAFAPRGKISVPNLIGRDLWEIGLKKTRPAQAKPPAEDPNQKTTPAPAKKSVGFLLGAMLAASVLYLARRRK